MIWLALLVGCLEPVQSGPSCGSCHGSAASPAPPSALGGSTDTAYVGVGAHASHAAVACGECHLVPDAVDAEGHIDTWPAEIRWGPLASADGVARSWDRVAGTCAVYCHGATLSGGTLTSPVWTVVDGTQAACGTCHGLPPPPPHEQDDACGDCHFPTAGPDGAIANAATHGDGLLQVGAQGETCGGCHGTDANPAPPPSTDGGSDPATRGVGAHAAHVAPAGGTAVACRDCHVVPGNVGAAGHMNGAPAEVVLSGFAAHDGAGPSWDAVALTCSDTYCHGGTLGGGAVVAPTWTDTSGAASACGACHGLPPPAPHTASTACGDCHFPTVGPDGAIADPSKHGDGLVQVGAQGEACGDCHGTPDNPAPPPDNDGGTDPSTRSVGAHAAHLFPANAAPVACGDCHVVPGTVDAAGHIDAAPAEVVLSGRAAKGGASPSWNPDALTCSGTYCHGAASPVWTDASGDASACGACHGMPPPSPHPSGTNCSGCHPPAGAGATIDQPNRHVDGRVDR